MYTLVQIILWEILHFLLNVQNLFTSWDPGILGWNVFAFDSFSSFFVYCYLEKIEIFIVNHYFIILILFFQKLKDLLMNEALKAPFS